jgi:hypothetical protein
VLIRTNIARGNTGENRASDGDRRLPPEACAKLAREVSIESSNGSQRTRYELFFVEFDDQGRQRDTRQWTQLKDELTALKASTEGPHDDYGGVSLLVSVHGWRHDAHYDDDNVRAVRQLLEKANQLEQHRPYITPNFKPRKVIGVYLGWRGKSLTFPLPYVQDALEGVSFWDRKFTAEEVAMGSVREVLAWLSNYRDLANEGTQESECARGLLRRIERKRDEGKDRGEKASAERLLKQ